MPCTSYRLWVWLVILVQKVLEMGEEERNISPGALGQEGEADKRTTLKTDWSYLLKPTLPFLGRMTAHPSLEWGCGGAGSRERSGGLWILTRGNGQLVWLGSVRGILGHF